jgi:hypothetical protein
MAILRRSGVNHVRWALFVGLFLSLATFMACSGGDHLPDVPGSLAVTVDTMESGAVRVRSRGEAPAWGLEEVVTLEQGDPDARPNGTFGAVSAVAVDRSDAIWVADAGTRQIRVFGARGTLIRLIGGEGDGPGQFGTLNSIAQLGRSVIALDSENQRIAEFSLGGGWQGERPTPFAGPVSPETLRFYPVGPAEVYVRSVREGDDGLEHVWIRHVERGVSGSRPVLPDPPDAPPTIVTCEAPAGDARSFPIPYQPRQLQHPASGGQLALAWTGDYRVAFLDPVGDTVQVVERERVPVPVTESDWEAALAPYRAYRTDHPDAVCDPAELIRPERMPPIRDILVDAAGRLLVEAATPEGNVWDVYGLTGYPLGTLPSFERTGSVAPYITTERIVRVTEGATGIQQIGLLRIVR